MELKVIIKGIDTILETINDEIKHGLVYVRLDDVAKTLTSIKRDIKEVQENDSNAR